MAAMNFSLRPLEFSTSTTAINHRKPATFLRRKPPISISFATTSPETTATSPVEKPEIELEFIGPKPGADGKPPVDRAKAISGEKLLRNIMLDNNIELYAAYVSLISTQVGFYIFPSLQFHIESFCNQY
ncbi:photosynthetic NDH subunit of subcomplex B 3, chloroplastic [Olea europaea subsp. europaea]|uniref:Photosynthetic NDH subunit of subcomplex B 3, chloroplastic n=1 Tax=Olea europaea subsp. europaea TaxID=158383 RepID=A0A8S0UC73_OLEEU|nr:photosynthetic NDH subunit of subcomplex B 3, chloroplastic [Olea europaea subsp. europaea]